MGVISEGVKIHRQIRLFKLKEHLLRSKKYWRSFELSAAQSSRTAIRNTGTD